MSASQSLPERQPGTGQTSIGSPEWMKATSGKLLAAVPLIGLESVRRTNKTIDDVQKRHLNANMQIYGDEPTPSEDEDMGDDSSLVLGNKTENHYYGHQQKNSKGMKGVVVGALLAAALFGGGFALSHFLQQPEKETVERIIDRVFDSDISMEIIPPE